MIFQQKLVFFFPIKICEINPKYFVNLGSLVTILKNNSEKYFFKIVL